MTSSMTSPGRILATACLAALALPRLASAAPADTGHAAVVQAISDCRKITENDARLACYDKAAGAFDQAQAQGQVVVVDREQIKTVRRQAFGFAIPSFSIFQHAPKDEAIDRVTVDLANAHHDAAGKWVMITTEDAVWRQIDDQDLYNPPHQGSKVAIRRAMLGSFFCNVDGQTAIRCTRER